MNVTGQENTLVTSRIRGRGRGRGRVGTIVNNQTNLVPKYRIPEFRRPLVSLAPSSSTTTVRTARRLPRVNTPSSSSARRGTPGRKSTDTSGPGTTSTSLYPQDQFVILAVTSGRGQARGEVGMAVIDIQCPHMILCQMSDHNSYVNTLTKIHIFQPIEILMPDTMGRDHNDPNSLYNAIKSRFPSIEITEISRQHWNAPSGLERIQTHCVNEFSSIELIVRQKYYALSAVCALFKYIETIQHIVYTQNTVKFEYQVAQNAAMIDLESAQNLELVTSYGTKYNYSLLGALDRCSTPAGRRLLRASILQPPCNLETIVERQNCVNELVSNKSLYAIMHPVIRRFYGVHKLLSFMSQRTDAETIEAAERSLNYALLLKHTLDVIPELRTALRTAESPFFKRVAEHLNNESYNIMRDELLRVIQPNALSVNGYASSTYQRCFAIKSQISDALDVARQTYCEVIDDMEKIVTAIGERYNLALTLGCSSSLGYHIEMKLPKNFKFDTAQLPPEFIEVHRQGAVLHMTTQEIFVKNQHCKDACIELHLMSNAVLSETFDIIKAYIGCLFELNDHVAELDLILSHAVISSIPDFVRPTFGESLEVLEGKHPVMDILGPESPTANDVVANAAYNFHTISGPNMSGKTIYLKQIVLLHIVAQIGCFVPARRAQFRITDHMFCRIGIRDDIQMNASSFMLEIKESQYILQSLTPTSLVVLDELCRSTTVEEGASIAWAICKRLLLSGAFTFSATHFEFLLRLAEVYPNVTNHHFEAVPNPTDRPEEARLVYTHRLKRGVQTIENYGLTLARSTCLPEEVMAAAQRFAAQIQETMEAKPTPSNEHESKVKRNYDKVASVYQKLEDDEVEDEELYALVKGLESISYEEPVETPQPEKTREESSGLFSEGPRASSMNTPCLRSLSPQSTSPKKTTSSSALNTKPRKPVKRQVTFSPAPGPEAKVPRLKDKRPILSLPTRMPLRALNAPPEQKNSQFKVPTQPQLFRKNSTDDPESPLFIARTPQQVHQAARSSITSDSSSTVESFLKPSVPPPKINNSVQRLTPSFATPKEVYPYGTFVKPQTAVPRASPKRRPLSHIEKYIPKSFHHFFTTVSPQPSTSGVVYPNASSQPVRNVEPNAEVVASLPAFLRPLRDDCIIPDEYRHLRHILKNISTSKEDGAYRNPVLEANPYYFVSKELKRTPAGSVTSHSDVDIQQTFSVPSPPLTRMQQVIPSSDEADNLTALQEVSIVISSESDDEESREIVSNCSVDSQQARISARRKEADIFRQIEGRNFDDATFFEHLKSNF